MTVTNRTISQDEDGFYHPCSEAEIIELIRLARENDLQIRCRGAAHSVARSIYTDPGPGETHSPLGSG